MLFVLSVLMNGYLLLLVKAQMAGGLATTVVQKGADDQVVALYTISGLIDDEAANDFAAFGINTRDFRHLEYFNTHAIRFFGITPCHGIMTSYRAWCMVQSA